MCGLEWGRPSDVKALAIVDAQLSKQVERLFVFDAFPDGLQAEA